MASSSGRSEVMTSRKVVSALAITSGLQNRLTTRVCSAALAPSSRQHGSHACDALISADTCLYGSAISRKTTS